MADACFLGKPHIKGLDGHDAPSQPEDWKRVALLAYLCLDLPLELHTDSALGSLLWPNLPGTVQRRTVQRAVDWLNSGQEEAIVSATRYGEYGAIQSAFSVDAWAFRGGVRLRAYGDALMLFQGDLLEGLDFPDAPLFMEWLRRQRTKYARLASLCAWRAYRIALDDGDQHLAGGLLVLAYERSPEPRNILSRVMELLASLGVPKEALRLFHREADPTPDAVAVARRLDPSLQPDPPKLKKRWLVGVAGTALLMLLVVFALPRSTKERPAANDAPGASAPEQPPAPSKLAAGDGGPRDPETPLVESATIWRLAMRHLDRGSYEEAAGLLRLLLADPDYGEQALESTLMAYTAIRGASDQDTTGSHAGSALAEATGVAGHQPANALLELWRNDVSGSIDRPDGTGQGASKVDWLAPILLALRNGDLARAYALIADAPDAVFHSSEGPLPNAQFLGWIAAANADSILAREHFTAAKLWAASQIRIQPEDPWAHRNVALAELGLGDRGLAFAALETAEAYAAPSENPQLRFKLIELRAILLGSSSEEGAQLIEVLLGAEYPWPLQPWQLQSDPRWSQVSSPVTNSPTGPGP